MFGASGCQNDANGGTQTTGQDGEENQTASVPVAYTVELAEFESNGDLISGWYWLRDQALEDYARWTISDLPETEGDLQIEMTALATNTMSGGRGFDADFLLYWGEGDPEEDEGTNERDINQGLKSPPPPYYRDQNPNYIRVHLPNISPENDPVGYTCRDTVTIPAAALEDTDTLVLTAYRETAADNHVAFNAESINVNITVSGDGDTNNDAQSDEDDQTWNTDQDESGHNYGDLEDDGDSDADTDAEVPVDSDGDSIYDDDEPLYGTSASDPDSDDDGVLDGEDLSPMINPGEPDLLSMQKIGMIRIEQPIKAYGLDGWAEKWNLDIDYACRWGICIPVGSELVKKADYEDEGTKKSTMNQTEYKKALNTVFADSHFTAYKMEDIEPMDIGVQDTELTHDNDEERGLTYPASYLHPNEYRFFYDDLTDYQLAYLKNNTEIKYPDDDNYFQYYLYPVKLQTGKEQSFSMQYADSGMYQALTYTDDTHYKVPGFLYAFYASDDFNSDTNTPYREGLAMGLIEKENQFMATFRLPEDQATRGTSWIKITPVWVQKNGSSTSYLPMDPNWDITGITRDVVYLKDDAGNSKTVSEEFSSFDGWNTTPKSMASFTGNQTAAGYTAQTEWMGIIKKDPDAEGSEYTVMDVTQTVITYLSIGVDALDTAASYTESMVQASNGVDDLDDLPDGHWAKSAKYSNATNVVGAAGGIITMVTNGDQAWTAWKDGDYVDVAYYSFQAAGGALDTATAMVQIAEKSFGYAGKATKLSKLGCKKAAAGIAVAVGVVEVSYDIYKYSQTNDPILQTAYAENIASDAIDTGISVAAVFSPHTLVFQLTWTAEAEIYALIFGEDFAYQVAQSPGSAAVFLTEYFFTDIIPSQMAEAAYLDARGGTEDDDSGLLDQIENENAVQLPYMSIFIDPDLE